MGGRNLRLYATSGTVRFLHEHSLRPAHIRSREGAQHERGGPGDYGIAALAIDCTDPPGLAHWWRRLLGGTVEVHPQGYATLHTPEGLALDFLPVPEPKTGKNRLHLDVRSHDFVTAVEQALALGATHADDIYAGGAGRCSAIPRATSSAYSDLVPREQ